MENNLINSRKANIALILKPHKDNTQIFFKGKEERRETGEGRREETLENVH